MNVFSLNSNKISDDMAPQKNFRGPLRRKCEPLCHSVINFTSPSRAQGLPRNDLRPGKSYPLTYLLVQWILIPAAPPEC